MYNSILIYSTSKIFPSIEQQKPPVHPRRSHSNISTIPITTAFDRF